MNGNYTGNGNGTKWIRMVAIIVAFLQPFMIAAIIYWAGRVDANTITNATTKENVAEIRGQLNQMIKQLDRIEQHLEEK